MRYFVNSPRMLVCATEADGITPFITRGDWRKGEGGWMMVRSPSSFRRPSSFLSCFICLAYPQPHFCPRRFFSPPHPSSLPLCCAISVPLSVSTSISLSISISISFSFLFVSISLLMLIPILMNFN
jgi:hypothetical protein